MTSIKNILFDLGGVLLNINYHKTADAFKDLGVKNFDELYSQAAANDFFERLEKGEITEEEFYSTMQQYCKPFTPASQIQIAWNAMLLDIRVNSLKYLEILSERYNLYLLSNTNSIHLSAFTVIVNKAVPLKTLDGFFKKCYYSHIIQMRKPYLETYKFLLSDAGINADETLFIDDSEVNIEGAIKAGLITHLLKPDETIEQLNL